MDNKNYKKSKYISYLEFSAKILVLGISIYVGTRDTILLHYMWTQCKFHFDLIKGEYYSGLEVVGHYLFGFLALFFALAIIIFSLKFFFSFAYDDYEISTSIKICCFFSLFCFLFVILCSSDAVNQNAILFHVDLTALDYLIREIIRSMQFVVNNTLGINDEPPQFGIIAVTHYVFYGVMSDILITCFILILLKLPDDNEKAKLEIHPLLINTYIIYVIYRVCDIVHHFSVSYLLANNIFFHPIIVILIACTFVMLWLIIFELILNACNLNTHN